MPPKARADTNPYSLQEIRKGITDATKDVATLLGRVKDFEGKAEVKPNDPYIQDRLKKADDAFQTATKQLQWWQERYTEATAAPPSPPPTPPPASSSTVHATILDDIINAVRKLLPQPRVKEHDA
mmetsp:Transcript_29746/g.65831  ORF Transcript_29746/g.65831 Transcript_29746/m.65831 type:complete len:125 (-) Transcript_29746:795-1169(-)